MSCCRSGSQEEGFVIVERLNKSNSISGNGPSITNPEPVIAGINEDKGKLVLFVSNNGIYRTFGGGLGIANNNNLNLNEIMDKLKRHVYVKCDKGIFEVTFDEPIEVNSNGAFLSVKSIASQDGGTSSDKVRRHEKYVKFE